MRGRGRGRGKILQPGLRGECRRPRGGGGEERVKDGAQKWSPLRDIKLCFKRPLGVLMGLSRHSFKREKRQPDIVIHGDTF